MKIRLWRLFMFLCLGLVAAGCSTDEMTDEEAALTASIRSQWGDRLYALDDAPAYPPDNGPGVPGYTARVALGKSLFYEPLLSGDNDISCGHCHHPGFAWGDGRDLSVGVGGAGLGPNRLRTVPAGQTDLEEWEFITPRNSPTILDAGRIPAGPGADPWLSVMFWDGRTASLESQARAPLRSRDEMRHDAYGGPEALTVVCDELRAIPAYVDAFQAAFPTEFAELEAASLPATDLITANTYSRAMAAYERELYTEGSPFDRFVQGDDQALSMAQKRGLKVFFEAGCDACHGGAMFTDSGFYALGVAQGGPGRPPIHENGDGTDYGRFGKSNADVDRYRFRSPTLRNLSLTAPYFHTGGAGSGGDYQTLKQVVEFFNRGGNDLGIDATYLDPAMVPLGLGEGEVDDLVAFLESLTATRIGSSLVDPEVPVSVPSGLAPPAVLEPVLRN